MFSNIQFCKGLVILLVEGALPGFNFFFLLFNRNNRAFVFPALLIGRHFLRSNRLFTIFVTFCSVLSAIFFALSGSSVPSSPSSSPKKRALLSALAGASWPSSSSSPPPPQLVRFYRRFRKQQQPEEEVVVVVNIWTWLVVDRRVCLFVCLRRRRRRRRRFFQRVFLAYGFTERYEGKEFYIITTYEKGVHE